MYAQSRKKPTESAISLTPPETTEGELGAVSSNASMTQVVTKLAQLRERYFSELEAARERVKKNFLR